MRLSLVGEAYTLRSVAAGVQSCMNLMPQVFDDVDEQNKNKWMLIGTPGYHSFAQASGGGIRGTWSGGGRYFVVCGVNLIEFDSNGLVVSTNSLGADDGFPVQMFGNGNQLGIIANGYFYIDNGAGPVQARFSTERFDLVIDAATNTKITSALHPFSAADVGNTFVILTTTGGWLGGTYTILSVTTAVATLSGSAGTLGSINGDGIEYDGTTGGLVTAVTGAYLDGSFFVQRPSGGTPDLGRQVNFSGVNDGTSWNALDFFTKESYPDYISSIWAFQEQLYVMGTESAEVWQNSTTTGRPIRLPGAAAKVGSVARYGIADDGEKLYFVGGPPLGQAVAYILDGFTPRRISTHAVEASWAAQDAFMPGVQTYCSIEDGHFLWFVNNSSSPLTWVYDRTTSELVGKPTWHQRAHWNPASGGFFEPYKLWYHNFIPEWGSNGKHIVADYNLSSGKIWEQSLDFYDDDGQYQRHVRALAHLYSGTKRQYLGRLDIEAATGLVDPAVPAPQIILDGSKDRGQTFTNPRAASMGVAGQYSLRIFWLQLGSARDYVPRLTIMAQSQVCLIDAEMGDYMGGIT